MAFFNTLGTCCLHWSLAWTLSSITSAVDNKQLELYEVQERQVRRLLHEKRHCFQVQGNCMKRRQWVGFFKPQPQALSTLQDYLFTKSSANWSHAGALIDRSPCLFGLRCVISTSDSLLLKTGTNYPSRMADTLTILCLAAGQPIQTPLASQFLFYDALSLIYHQQLYRFQRTLLTTSHPACNITSRGFWPAGLEKAKLTCKVILQNSACQERMKHTVVSITDSYRISI